jgi:imidazole glycerol-phosphate synthase subunit HisF
MIRTRVIPVLLLKNKGLVKTTQFSQPKYVGDPMNAVKIFNDKEVNELIILDIESSKTGQEIDFGYLQEIASESFMPVCYGGGLKSMKDLEMVFRSGFEKVSLNTSALENRRLISEAADYFGVQAVIVSIDVKKNLLGHYQVMNTATNKATGIDPVTYAREVTNLGAGEILINAIDRDGMQKGYDINLINKVSSAVEVPVVACGGAGSISDFREAVDAGASAVSAGSMFVFNGKHRAVLISYPQRQKLASVLGEVR